MNIVICCYNQIVFLSNYLLLLKSSLIIISNDINSNDYVLRDKRRKMMKKKQVRILLLGILGLLFLTACGQTKETTENKQQQLKIVTTFYPMYDFTRNVVGDQADLYMLID